MLKQGLEKLGHEVYVVTVNDESFSYKEEDGVLKIPSFPIGLMNFRQSGIYPLKALKIIKKWKLDIIHSHTEFSIGTFARLISKQLNIPLVHTYHTMYEEYIYYITKGYFDSASKKLVEYLTLFLCDKTIDELIVPTEKAKELFKDKYKVKRDVYVIPSGIDTTRFYKENIDKNEIINLKKDLGLKKTDFIVLYVGRIAKEKSIDFLINNFNSVLKQIPKAKMIIVGDGPDIKDLIDLAKKEGLENKIIFAGKAPWTDVPKYYSLCDVFVTASKTETQGLTVMEAMGASKPVVAIRDESFELMITDKKDGLFFDDEKSYVDMIYEVYKNKKLRDEISFNARLTADKYSPYNYAKNVLKVYEKVISKDTNVVKKVVHNVKNIFTKSGGKK
jgi:1,2-diacylglycerol 3-alpha-glucosyltransferase